MNKHKTMTLSGLGLLIFGTLWEIASTDATLFNNILGFIFPIPTYRFFEIGGLILFGYGIVYYAKCKKEELEQQ